MSHGDPVLRHLKDGTQAFPNHGSATTAIHWLVPIGKDYSESLDEFFSDPVMVEVTVMGPATEFTEAAAVDIAELVQGASGSP